MPASFVFRTNQGKAYTADTYFIFGKPAPVTINSVVASASPFIYPVTTADVSGTSITNGVNYKVLSFASVSTTTSYTVNYSCTNATTIYVLAVGGGGGGGIWLGGGGGAGGVVMMPVYLQPGTNQTISIYVGAGGSGATSGGSGASNGQTGGYNTTLTFTPSSSSSIPNIIASGGGSGGCNGNLGGVVNSSGTLSGGGGAGYNSSTTAPTPANNNNYNFANGGAYASGSGSGGGGGGAGTIGQNSFVNGPGVNGGNGIQCVLPGINNFSPSGTTYGTYYWGGGGGSAGNNSPAGPGGNGGFGGGGGGGGGLTSQAGGSGGGGGINSGYTANASPNYGGAGGANTGGGGGATYGAAGGTVSGAGGSGIVIIAFPTVSAVTSNMSAVLPASIVSSGLYSATLNNATLSSLAYSSIKGAYACRLLNYNYFGPVMTLRYSTDTTGSYTQNFYADVFGNLGTQYLGTGQSVSAWLSAASGANTTYAYVTKWYGQGMDASFNSATQYTTTLQPIYDVANGLINFGWTGGGGGVSAPTTDPFFNLPNGALPYSDASYSYVLKHLNAYSTSGTTGTFFCGGVFTTNQVTALLLYNNGYDVQWQTDYVAGTYAANNVVSMLYNSTGNTTSNYRTFYQNGIKVGGDNLPNGIRAQQNTPNYIGSSSFGTYAHSNFQMYYMYIFSSSLAGADRLLVEATPYTYSASATTTIAGLVATNVTSTNFSLSWTALASPNYYILWVNRSMYGSYTAGSAGTFTTTVTPGVSGPLWALNLYAYNSSNVLLASGTTNVFPLASASKSINSGATQTANGSNTVFTYSTAGTYYFTVATSGIVSVLIVGGGGAGGTNWAGGGGSGGLVYYDLSTKPMTLTAGSYNVTVGAGGTGSTNNNGNNGTSSSFNGVIASGGGGGGGSNLGTGNTGGCGGGGGGNSLGGASTQAAYPSAFYVGGYAGNPTGLPNGGGGGGGSGGAGGAPISFGGTVGASGSTGGAGGLGYSSNITGSSLFYAGGGGGIYNYGSGTLIYQGGVGGSGVGGNGAINNNSTNVASNGSNATYYGGGGGGGSGTGSGGSGGSGYSGVVIILCQGV